MQNLNVITIKAINALHAALINRIYKADRKYSDLLRANEVELETTGIKFMSDKYARLEERLDGKAEAAYDRLNNMAQYLPAKEVANFQVQYKAAHGYESYAF